MLSLSARPNLLVLARACLVAQAIGATVLVAGTHGWIVPLPRPVTTDFVSFYAAGRLALRGAPEAAYDRAAHAAEEETVAGRGIATPYFFYPPPFLLLCALLALLPYLGAYAVFQIATAALFAAGMGAILPRWRGRWTILAALPSAWWCAGIGQNAFLTAGLLASGTALLARRPLLAGAALGGLAVKPHIALLVPVALVAGRQFRALAGFLATGAGLVFLSVVCFGPATWTAFLGRIVAAGATLSHGAVRLSAQVSIGVALRLLGAPEVVAGIGQGAAIMAAVWLVWRAWRDPAHPALARAALAACIVIAMPAMLFYDLLLAAVGAAWLLAEAQESGLRRGEASLLGLLFALDLLAYPFAQATGMPVGAAIAPALILLILRRRPDWVRPSNFFYRLSKIVLYALRVPQRGACGVQLATETDGAPWGRASERRVT